MNIKKISVNFLLTALAIVTLVRCRENTETQAISLLDNYQINSTALYPEGVDYDAKNNRFVVGSFYKGAVYSLSADGKTFQSLITDTNLVATTGIYTDEANDRLIVASGDAGASEKSGAGGSTAGQRAYLGVYKLSDGTLIKGIDLKPLTPNAGAFPNGIAVDSDGNIYVTDSFSPIIYKVDKAYTASIFTTNANLFTPAAGSFGLNGIVYSTKGYFVVAKTNDNKFFKVPLNNPGNVTEITGVADKTKAPDGLAWTSDDTLAVVENGLADGKVHLLGTDNDWTTAAYVKEIAIGKEQFPTSATLASNNEIYVLSTTWLGKLLGGNKTESAFVIKKVDTK
jgi:sugar lactone lactonase YvrE